jgi:hypothetical protein
MTTTEGRKYVRFLVKDGLFAALRNGFDRVGKINDISINGLHFSFLGEIAKVNSVGHHTQIDIFSSATEDRCHLFKLPCKIVYEIPDATPDEGLLVRMSHCGLQFGNLAGSQLKQLKLFIDKFTTGISDVSVT